MQPTKNTIYCHGCQRSKMLFETKGKADNFIKYNSDGILEENGKAPVRSYYCEFCGGYHVTSNPSKVVGEMLSDRDHKVIEQIESIKREGEEFDSYSQTIRNKLKKAKKQLYMGHFQDAEDLYSEFQLDVEALRKLPMKKRTKYMLLHQEVDTLYNLSVQLRELLVDGQQEQEKTLVIEKPTKSQKFLLEALKIIPVVKHIENDVQQVMSLLQKGETEEAHAKVEEMRVYMSEHEDIGENAFTECMKKINFTENQIARKKNELKNNNTNPEMKDGGGDYTEAYKSSILAVIDRIEKVKRAFNNGEADSCENHLEIAYFLLDELKDDNNKKLLQSQLEMWRDKIYNHPSWEKPESELSMK